MLTTDTPKILMLEQLSYRALPALYTRFYDGWLLRFSGGYTRRANSVNPIFPSKQQPDEDQDIQARIDLCEALYTVKHMPVHFKMTAAAHPPELDALLARRGYRQAPSTGVWVFDLNEYTAQALTPADGLLIRPHLTDEWLHDLCFMDESAYLHRDTLRQMLTHIIPPTAFASLRLKNKTVAIGMAVLDAGYLGLFNIITAPKQRRRGYATQIINSLMAWGQQQGADHAYLQVMDENGPARQLYNKLGFYEVYKYWYRSR